MQIAHKKTAWYLFFAVMLFMGFFYGLSAYAIHDNNEGLYAEIAREMLNSHQYAIAHLNGVPYIEKPPLFYWLILLSYKLFGFSIFAARLVPAVCGASVCISLLWFARKLQNPFLGIISGLILASSIGFIIISRVIFFDMALTASLTLCLLNFYIWHQQRRVMNLYLSYLFLASGFMIKGLVAVAIAGPIAVLFLALSNSSGKTWREFFNPVGLLIFFGIIGTWVMFACQALPHFLWDFFVNENWYRFLGKRIPMDYYHGPIYYYIPRLFIYLFPWLFLIPSVFGKVKRPFSPLSLLLWLWFLVPFALFSLGSDKGNYYMVVASPALAILLGIQIDKWIDQHNFKWLACLFSFTAIIIAIALVGAYFSPDAFPEMKSFTLILATVTLLLIAFMAGLLLISKNPLTAFVCTVLLIIPLELFGIRLLQARDNTDSEIRITQYIISHDPQRPVYLYQSYEELSSVLFYLQRTVPIIDTISRDLYYGSHSSEAKNYFIDSSTFRAIAKHQAVYVIMKNGHTWNRFQTQIAPIQFCLLTQSVHAILATNKLSDCLSVHRDIVNNK